MKNTKLYKKAKPKEWIDETHYWAYVPVYEKYIKKEVPTYCDECGQKNGVEEISNGVNLLGYHKKKYEALTSRSIKEYYDSKLMDYLTTQPILSQRLKGVKK